MRWLAVKLPVMVWLAAGCSQPAAELRPGDVVRPEISFAPAAPWPVAAKVSVGVLIRVERPGAGRRYLRDEEVAADRAVMTARVTFWDGDNPVGDPLDVPLVRDC